MFPATQILPADNGRSNYLRVAQTVANMMNPKLTVEEFINSYKFYDDELVLLQPLSTSQTQYVFNPVRGLDTPTPTQNLMDKSDLFAVCGVGVFFTLATYSSTTGLLSAYGNYEQYTYPYAAVFSGANEQAGLMNIVRGTIALSVNSDQQWKVPVDRLVFKKEFINAQATTIQYGGDNASQGILDLNALVIMDGENQNQLALDLATGGTLTNIDGNTHATTRNIIGIKLIGFRVRNVANGGFTAANCRVS